MKEIELIKKATDIDMPNFERVKSNIILEKKNTSTFGKKVIWVFASLCVLIFSIFTTHNFISQQEKSNDGNGIANLEDESKDTPSNVSEINIQIVFNDIDETSGNSSKVYFDPEKTYKKDLTVNEVISYLGMDVRPSKVPEG